MTRLDGICLLTEDVPALAHFYGKCFGVPVEASRDFAWVHLPGTTLSIFSSTGMTAMAPGWRSGQGNGSMTLEIEVDDVEQALARAVEFGCPVVKPVTTQPWGRTSAWFRDPDGTIVNCYRSTREIDPESVVREYFRRLFDERDLTVCDERLSPGYVDHDAPPGTPPGPEATRRYVEQLLRDDPDLRVEVLIMVAQGRTVAARVRWMPGPASTEKTTEGLLLIEIDEQGRLRERSSYYE